MSVLNRAPDHIIKLNSAELLIRRSLESANASPFLAHWDLTDANRDKYVESFKTFLRGDAYQIPRALRRWPLTSVWNFANALSSQYGTEGHAVYSVLEGAFDVKIVDDVRNSISKAFRAVCRKYGLCFDGSGRRVDDYLAQAGIANAQLHHVARAFLLAERAYGLPAYDNTVTLNTWEDDASHFLPVGVNIPRMVLEVDQTAHYAFQFSRFRHQEKPCNSFEERFFAAIDRARATVAGGGASQAVPRPSLVWTDSGLALLLPKVDGRLSVSIAGKALKLRGGQYWELPTPWPAYIDWGYAGHSERMSVIPTAQCLLIFEQETGRLTTSADMAAEKELLVDAREVVLVGQIPFDVNGESAYRVAQGFASHASLSATPIAVLCGERRLNISAKPKLRIWLQSEAIATGPKGPLVPAHVAIGVEFGELEDDSFALALSFGGIQRIVELQRPADADHMIFTIPADLITGCDVGALRVELRLHGSNRALVRYKAWLWSGLRGLNDGFVFDSDRIPLNFSSIHSRHIIASDSGKLCLDTQGAYDVAKLAFEVGGDRVDFLIPRPGESLSIIDVEGRVAPLRIGDRLVVREEDKGGSLKIRCPDASASLMVRGRHEPFAFKKSSTRVLSLAELLSPAPSDEIIIQKSGPASVPLLLTQIVPAACPRMFKPERVHAILTIQLEMEIEIDAVRLSLEDERGRREECDYALRDRTVPLCAPSWLRAEFDEKRPERLIVKIHLDAFHGDLTLASIAVRRTNTESFRPLRNMRGDNYAVVMGAPRDVRTSYGIDVDEVRHRFITINEWMARCFAQESWDYVGQRIAGHWSALGKELSASPEGRGLLINAAHVSPPPGSPKSWIPLAHPLRIDPELYSAPFETFLPLAVDGVEGLEDFAILGESASRHILDIHRQFGISVAFLTAFDNVTAHPATGFKFERYLSSFQKLYTDHPEQRWFWRPGDELLGTAHYSAAFNRFIDRLYEAGLEQEGSNDVRIRNAATVANCTYRMQERALPILPDMEVTHGIIESVPYFISAFARASRQGSASEYLDMLTEKMGRSVVDDASFMIRLAPELLAFYLLFWELSLGGQKR